MMNAHNGAGEHEAFFFQSIKPSDGMVQFTNSMCMEKKYYRKTSLAGKKKNAAMPSTDKFRHGNIYKQR
jgi:hypothetical protein